MFSSVGFSLRRKFDCCLNSQFQRTTAALFAFYAAEKNDVASDTWLAWSCCELRWRRLKPTLLEGGQKKCQARGLADYEANKNILREGAITCQVIICVEENNPR